MIYRLWYVAVTVLPTILDEDNWDWDERKFALMFVREVCFQRKPIVIRRSSNELIMWSNKQSISCLNIIQIFYQVPPIRNAKRKCRKARDQWFSPVVNLDNWIS